MKLILFLLFVSSTVICEKNYSTELKLHSIFNQKLLTPLKLDSEETVKLLVMLNMFSKQMLAIEDRLKENLLSLKVELRKQSEMDAKQLQRLNKERADLIIELNDMEKKKIDGLSDFLSPDKLAFFFVLREKLMHKFRKAIRVESLTDKSISTEN